jgi:hypothetical protein
VTSTTTTAGDVTSTTSTGPMCAETPCKLTEPQCGCASGKECGISNFAVACVKAGTKGWGTACSNQFDCGPGFICLGGGTTDLCVKFCDTDADCTQMGGICAVQLSDGTATGSIPGVQLCSNACDPTKNTGCPTGMTCRIGQEQSGQMRWFGICSASGTAGEAQSCTRGTDCKARFDCFLTNGADECFEYCDADLNNCPAGQTCSALVDANMAPIVLNNKSIGACQ